MASRKLNNFLCQNRVNFRVELRTQCAAEHELVDAHRFYQLKPPVTYVVDIVKTGKARVNPFIAQRIR